MKQIGLVDSWHDRNLIPGEVWDKKIRAEIAKADLIIMLISPDFLASNYIMNTEVRLAFKRMQNENIVIIPIILRPCLWEYTSLARIQATSKANPIVMATNKDLAWVEAIKQLEKTYNEINKKS